MPAVLYVSSTFVLSTVRVGSFLLIVIVYVASFVFPVVSSVTLITYLYVPAGVFGATTILPFDILK